MFYKISQLLDRLQGFGGYASSLGVFPACDFYRGWNASGGEMQYDVRKTWMISDRG